MSVHAAWVLGEDHLLGPFEGMRVLVVRRHQGIDPIPHLLGRGETAAR
jgi:hypothetical protein